MTDPAHKTRVGLTYKNEATVYIGRGKNARNILDTDPTARGWLGNPFVLASQAHNKHSKRKTITIVPDRETALAKFEHVLSKRIESDTEFRSALATLAGETLGCYCHAVGEQSPACHGDVIRDYIGKIQANTL